MTRDDVEVLRLLAVWIAAAAILIAGTVSFFRHQMLGLCACVPVEAVWLVLAAKWSREARRRHG